MNPKLRKNYRFLSHLPDNTELKFVVLRMEDFLSPETFELYIKELRSSMREEKRLEHLEDRKAEKRKKIYEEREKRKQSGENFGNSFPKYTKEMVELFDADILETQETFEQNKNNPEMYPELFSAKKNQKEEEFFQGLIRKYSELEDQIWKDRKKRKISLTAEKDSVEKKQEVKPEDPVKPYEEPKEVDFELVIIKKKPKNGKKRGKGRGRRN